MLLWGNGFWFTYFHPINKLWTKSVRVCVCYVPLAHISYIILVLQNICRWWNVTNRIPQFSKEKKAVVKIICNFFMKKRQKINFWLYLCHWYWPFIIFEIEIYNSFLLMTVFQSIGSQRVYKRIHNFPVFFFVFLPSIIFILCCKVLIFKLYWLF